jgi:hypothetical protein
MTGGHLLLGHFLERAWEAGVFPVPPTALVALLPVLQPSLQRGGDSDGLHSRTRGEQASNQKQEKEKEQSKASVVTASSSFLCKSEARKRYMKRASFFLSCVSLFLWLGSGYNAQ